jgi:hypothetical protein
MAWIDPGAYNVLEEYQCLPAHARQDPQVSGWLTLRLHSHHLVDLPIKGHTGIDSCTCSLRTQHAGGGAG